MDVGGKLRAWLRGTVERVEALTDGGSSVLRCASIACNLQGVWVSFIAGCWMADLPGAADFDRARFAVYVLVLFMGLSCLGAGVSGYLRARPVARAFAWTGIAFTASFGVVASLAGVVVPGTAVGLSCLVQTALMLLILLGVLFDAKVARGAAGRPDAEGLPQVGKGLGRGSAEVSQAEINARSNGDSVKVGPV